MRRWAGIGALVLSLLSTGEVQAQPEPSVGQEELFFQTTPTVQDDSLYNVVSFIAHQETDHNGAVRFNVQRLEQTIDSLETSTAVEHETHRFHVPPSVKDASDREVVVDSLQRQMRTTVAEASERYSVDLITFHAHGTPLSIDLVPAIRQFTTNDLDELFWELYAPDATVQLYSCSTGRCEAGGCFAAALSESTGLSVIAPEELFYGAPFVQDDGIGMPGGGVAGPVPVRQDLYVRGGDSVFVAHDPVKVYDVTTNETYTSGLVPKPGMPKRVHDVFSAHGEGVYERMTGPTEAVEMKGSFRETMRGYGFVYHGKRSVTAATELERFTPESGGGLFAFDRPGYPQ